MHTHPVSERTLTLQIEDYDVPHFSVLRAQPSPFMSIGDFVHLYNFGKEVR